MSLVPISSNVKPLWCLIGTVVTSDRHFPVWCCKMIGGIVYKCKTPRRYDDWWWNENANLKVPSYRADCRKVPFMQFGILSCVSVVRAHWGIHNWKARTRLFGLHARATWSRISGGKRESPSKTNFVRCVTFLIICIFGEVASKH